MALSPVGVLRRGRWGRAGLGTGTALGPVAPRPVPLTALVYPAAFGVVASYVAARPAPVRDAWLAALSTNLDNLAAHPVRALVGSAFVADESITDWVVLAFVGLAVAGRALGDLRLALLLAACHVDGTLVSQAIAGLQVRAGVLPASARTVLDVGPSYVVAPALVLGVVHGSTTGRVLAGVSFALLAPHLFGGLSHLEVSSVGHVVAIATALLVGPSLVADRRARAHAPA